MIDRSLVKDMPRPLLEKNLLGAIDEIERCHARLEIDHVFVMHPDTNELVRQEVPYEDRMDMSDGISCRDATISILEGDSKEREDDA